MVTTVKTSGDGTYETLVAIPNNAGATVSIKAVYDEDASNVSEADEVYIDLQTVLFDSARQQVQAGDANQVIKRAYIAVCQAVTEAKVRT